MAKSVDPIHDEIHCENQIANFSDFLRTEKFKKLGPLPNKKIIFFVILWHDIFASSIFKKNKIGTTLKYLFFDGRGSAEIFKKEAEKMGIEKIFIEKIAEIILYHGFFTKDLKNVEVQIFYDLDELETANSDAILIRKKENFFSTAQILSDFTDLKFCKN